MATFDEMQKAYTAQTDRAAAINQQYDAQKEAQLASLKQTYDQQVSTQQAAQQKIDPMYQQKANDLAVQYERNRRNFNMQAAGNGINTGTGSQAQLAMMSAYQRDYGNLRTAQADAQAEAQRGLADLEVGYQNQVQAALAQNDYERAAALTAEYKEKYNRDLAQAQTLAKYGDFSMYATLYGQDQANNMANAWKASNPDLAYNTGRISAQEYFAMTGQYPAGSPEYQAQVAAQQAAASGGSNYTGTPTITREETKQFGPGISNSEMARLMQIPLKADGKPAISEETLANMSQEQYEKYKARIEQAAANSAYTAPSGGKTSSKTWAHPTMNNTSTESSTSKNNARRNHSISKN